MRAEYRRGLICLCLTGVLALLAACYLPNHFQSEIRLGRTGDYALYFKGDLIWAPLYRDIKRGTFSPREVREKTAAVKDDLSRDSNFKSIAESGPATFQVEYDRQGRLELSDQVTFVRRNAIILMIRSFPDGRITVNGNTVKPSDAQIATSLGIDVQGEFRVTTDALVTEHNATQVKNFGAYTTYIWAIQNAFSPSPHLVMRREGAFAPTTKGAP